MIKRRYTEVDFNLDELENLNMADLISANSNDRFGADNKTSIRNLCKM